MEHLEEILLKMKLISEGDNLPAKIDFIKLWKIMCSK